MSFKLYYMIQAAWFIFIFITAMIVTHVMCPGANDMTIEAKLTLHCDLCPNSTPVLSMDDIPVGWSTLVQGPGPATSKHVCPPCMIRLKAAKIKERSNPVGHS